MICSIKDLRLQNKYEFGAKACSLGDLINNKITVPNGFALSTKIFDEFLQYNSFPFTNTDYLIHSEEIKTFLLNSIFSDKILAILEENYLAITTNRENVRFAVRSSAICEDTNNFSMAGMLHSYTNLASFEDVIKSIKKCYASLFQDKVLSFMINHNVTMDQLKMGVFRNVNKFSLAGRSWN
ncbi:MAG: PEP/pyruvate-binding domain-containing protein [Mobilitalea sp.]